MHFLRKLRSTLSILYHLGMARTFGTYDYSSAFEEHPGYLDFARYEWRGKVWIIPTGAVEAHDTHE